MKKEDVRGEMEEIPGQDCVENTILARYACYKLLIIKTLRNLKVKYVNHHGRFSHHSHCKGTNFS